MYGVGLRADDLWSELHQEALLDVCMEAGFPGVVLLGQPAPGSCTLPGVVFVDVDGMTPDESESFVPASVPRVHHESY